jgi:hypothetical protein
MAGVVQAGANWDVGGQLEADAMAQCFSERRQTKRIVQVTTTPIDVFAYNYDDVGRGYPDEIMFRVAMSGITIVDANIPDGAVLDSISWPEVRDLPEAYRN